MKFKSQVYTQTSGSIGGITYSHNRGGLYTRARAIPTDPNTSFQANQRQGMRDGVVAWGALTPGDRADWEAYAANVPMLDKLGELRPLTGQQQFLRAFLSIQTFARVTGSPGPIIGGGPTTFDLGSYTTPVPTVSAATGLSLAFTAADAWADNTGGYMLIFAGLQQNPSRNFYKSPFRAIGAIAGDTMTPPTSPKLIATALFPSALTVGNKVWLQFVVKQADDRLTTPLILPVTIAA